MTKTKAYSYLRISTDRQLSGDGIRRQLEQSKAYAEQHGYELVDTLQDVGVSAFKGKNAKEGALGMFIAAIDDGDIEQDSVLIVESLDRLSRDNVLTAFSQFTNIIQKGIGIVTLTDNQHYTTESISNNFSQLLISLTVMMRANEESVTKSKRLRAAFARKRANTDNEKLTALAPAWLELAEDRKSFHVIEDKAATVREIFRLSIDGMGAAAITKHLNEQLDKYPPISGGKYWHRPYVNKILGHPAVYGEFQSKEQIGNKKVNRGEPIENYYPTIVDKETFYLARSRIESRGHYKSAGAKGNTYTNLFSGITTCGECGGKMLLKNKGKPPKGFKYLRCGRSVHGQGCSSPAWRYSEFEEAFIDFVREVNFSEIIGEHDNSIELRDLEAKTASARAEIVELQKSYDALLARFEDPQLPDNLVSALVKRSEDIQDKINATEDRISAFENRKAELSTENISEDQETFLDAYEAVLEEKDETKLRELRFAMAGLLKRVVSNITTHNSMTLNPWEASFDAVSKRLVTELKEKGRKTDTALEKYFSTPNGQRHYQQAERYFVVKFVSGAVRVVQPYENATFKSVTERMLKFRTN